MNVSKSKNTGSGTYLCFESIFKKILLANVALLALLAFNSVPGWPGWPRIYYPK